jgi:hypothetical protein
MHKLQARSPPNQATRHPTIGKQSRRLQRLPKPLAEVAIRKKDFDELIGGHRVSKGSLELSDS